ATTGGSNRPTASHANEWPALPSTISRYPCLPAYLLKSQRKGRAVSLRGGALCARTSWVPASRRRIRFFLRGDLSGEPSCPAIKKLSFAGMVKGFERRIPVSFSPPGERLEMNWAVLSPSEELRFS